MSQLDDIDLIHMFTIALTRRQPELWSGFMKAGYSVGDHPVSSFIFLPIIDLSPTDMNCMYSTLLFLKNESDTVGKRPIITFDTRL